MGNSSSAADGRLDGKTFSLPRDGHVLRLWAEVFTASVDSSGTRSDAELKWTRVTEDIVPVNVSCTCRSSTTTFQVIAYNSQVEKVCDAYIEQPGHAIEHPSESFVHWCSKDTGKHWGLNFTSKDDALKFKTICTMTGILSVSKSTSFGTVRLAARLRGTVKEKRDPKKSLSTAGEISNGPPAERAQSQAVDGMLTLPRYHQRKANQRLDSRLVFAQGQAEREIVEVCSGQQAGVSASDTRAVTTRSGTVSAPVSPTEELQPSLIVLTRAGKNGTLCRDNLRSILYGSGALQSSRGAGTVVAPANQCTCGSADDATIACCCSADHEDDTATIMGDQSTLLGEATTLRACAAEGNCVSPAQRGSMCLPGSLALSHFGGAAFAALDDSTVSQLVPILQSTPLAPSFGSEASVGDPDISLPAQSTTPTSVVRDRAARPAVAWLSEPSAEARQCVRSCTDSGFGGTCSESAESIRSSALSDASSAGYGRAFSTSSSVSRRPGSSASSYSSEGSSRASSGRTARRAPVLAGYKTEGDVSDGDDSDSGHSMTTVTATGSLLSLAHQTGATRKAGWLDVKSWLVRRGRRVQVAPRRKWKRYWVSLKGGTLLFYARSSDGGALTSARSLAAREVKERLGGSVEPGKQVGSKDAPEVKVECEMEQENESLPRHLLDVSDCLVQSVPEHLRRRHVFALSTHRGDAYLFQAQSQVDHDQWIATIHAACASQYARQLGREDTQRMLIGEIDRLEAEIEQDLKMKKMAELQLSTTADAKSGRAIMQQMAAWEKKFECRHMDQYRYRCYLAALHGDGCGVEQPNPKGLLSAMSQSSKACLNRLGVLSVTTFHALICSRLSETYDAVLARCKRRGTGGGSFLSAHVPSRSSGSKLRVTSAASMATMAGCMADEAQEPEVGIVRSFSNSSKVSRSSRSVSLDESVANSCGTQPSGSVKVHVPSFSRNLRRVDLPNGQAMAVDVKEGMTADELLDYVCSKRQLTASECFLRVKPMSKQEFVLPHKTDCLGNMDIERIEICSKVVFQVELCRRERSCGLQLEAELADGAETEDELRVFVCALSPCSAAAEAGLVVGDEILVINGKMVSDLDMVFIESLVMSSSSLRMTVRSCRLEKPVAGRLTNQLMQHADIYISNMMCPPPPSQSRLPDKFIDELIVPAPNWVQAEATVTCDEPLSDLATPHHNPIPVLSDHKIKELLQNAEQVTHLCRMANERVLDEPPDSGHGDAEATSSAGAEVAQATLSLLGSSGQPLSEAQRLRKVVVELIDTERAYVKDLSCLIERYLEPLKEETFLSSEEVIHLFGNIQEIVHFQCQFLSNLEEASVAPEFAIPTRTSDLKGVLHSIAGSFLYYANHFRLYSSFCASHSRAQKVFTTEENAQLKEFLRARNPKQQHSATLESYLIKPIQRVLKYPLLLGQLRNLSQPGSDEQAHLNEALTSMENVAEHINEMQKIYEEYGHEFDKLMRQHNRSHDAPSYNRHHQRLHQQACLSAGSSTPAGKHAGTSPMTSDGSACHALSVHRKVEINVGDLNYYGEAEWLNAAENGTKPRKGFIHVTTIFVFKNGVVFLCQEKPKTKKKAKGGSSTRNSMVDNGNSSTCETVERLFMPVDCLQVRTLPTIHAHGPVALWELLHLKSAVDGRAAEKIYQLANGDMNTRDAFICNIRQIIKESVNRMTVPKGGRPGNKPRVASAADFLVNGTRAHEITTRYSMNFDLEKGHDGLNEPVPERSRTIGDLQGIENGYLDRTSLSQASLGSTDSTGAKLIYSSHDPVSYSSRGSLDADSPPGSPIWKQQLTELGEPLCTATAVFDFSQAVQIDSSSNSHRSLLLAQGLTEGATEC